MTELLLKKTKSILDKVEDMRQTGGDFDFFASNTIEEKKKKIELTNKFRSDIVRRIEFWEDTVHPFWIQSIKDYVLDTTDRYIDLLRKKKTFLTNEKQPIIRTYVDRLVQSIFRTNFTIKAYPLSEKREKKTKAVQTAIERCFASSSARKALFDMAKTAIHQGPGFARTSFNIPKEKAEDIKNTDSDQLYNIENFYANFEWVSEFCLYGEPHIPFYKQRDIIYRKILPMRTILRKLEALGAKRLEDRAIKYIGNFPQAFSYKDYDKVRLVKYYSNTFKKKNYNDQEINNINFSLDNYYNLKLDNNLCEYVEFWNEDNLVIYVNGYIVHDGENPLNINPERPPRVHPFKYISFTRDPGTWVSDGIGTLLAGQQRLYDGLYNISFDLLKFSAGPMFLLQPGQSIEGSEKLLNYDPFTFKQVKGPGKIEVLELPKPAPEVSKAMSDILDMANFAIAPAMYNQLEGISRSATDSQFRFEGLKDSVLSLVQSMNEMLSVVAEEWLWDIKEKMPNRFKIPVFGSDGLVKEREKIETEELEGSFVFEWDSESIRDINKVVERSQLGELSNFLKSFGQDPITNKWMLDNEKLLQEGLVLFNKSTDIILTDDQYNKKVKKAQEDQMEMQSELQEQQPQQQFGQGGQGGFNPGAQELPGSNMESNMGAIGGEAGTMGLASILKMANE